MAAKIYRINYKSDFILTMNSDAGWAVPFCIKFFTSVPSRAYFVGFDGTTYTHCAYDPSEPTKLVVQFDDHHLPIGDLNYQIAYHFTVADFPNDTEDEVINPAAITTEIDGDTYHVMLDFTGETAPEIEFNLPAYANEQQRIANEEQRQQNEADRIAAELQREQATAAAVQGAENVNAQLNGTTLTVTNRQGVSTSVNTKGEQGAQGPEGPQGEQGETGISIVSFTPKSETSTTLIYTVTFSDGHTQDVAIPKGPKGDTGATGPQGQKGDTGVSITAFTYASETETDMIYTVTFSDSTTQQVAIPKGAKGDTGPQGPQGPMGDVAVITPEQQAAFTMYSVPGNHTDGPMTQKAVTDSLVSETISYDNSESGIAAENVQEALDETASGVSELMGIFSGVKLVERFTLTGNNKTSAIKRFNNLIAGETYRLTVDLDTFDYSNSAINGYNIFSAGYLVGSQETVYFTTMKGTDTVVAVHEFVAADADYTYVLIRANAGCVVQFKIEELVANTEYIDDVPTEGSDKLVRSGGVYNSINNIVNELASTKFSIIGNGDTGVDYRFYPQAGSHCILVADLSTFIHTNVTSGYNIFSVFYKPRTSSTSVMVFRTMKGTDALVAKHEFDAVDAEYYAITIRANVGQEVDFSLTIVDEDGYIPVDNVPTKDSQNLVRSGGVYDMAGKIELLGKTLTLDSFTCSWATNTNVSSGYYKARYRCAIEVPKIPVYIKVENVPSGYIGAVSQSATLADALGALVYPVEDTSWGTLEHTFEEHTDALWIYLNFKIGSAGTAEFTQADMDAINESVTVSIYPWIETGTTDKTDIVSLNDEKRTVRYLNNLVRPNYSRDGRYTPGLTPFTLLHFSDLHSDTVNLRRLLEYKEHYASFIDDAILTGDNIRNRFSDSFAFWGNLGAEDILLSTGNHEYWNGSNYTTITPLQVYNKFFAPYYENWGDTVVFPANADTEGYNYYYKDYPTRNIRLFVLDSMANMNGNRNGVQAAWLATELENARVAGRHVICAIHIGSTLETPFNNSFTSYAVVFDAEESGINSPTFAEFYTLRDAVENFIDNGGKFVAWICGHRHKDSIAVLYKKVNNENVPLQQTSIHVATCSGGEFSGDAGGHGDTDSNNNGHSWWIVAKGDDCDRTDNTKQQDCFNIYSVDTEKQLLRIFRVGSDVDRNGRHKGSLVYDYANRQVLYYD